jgi:hypothetical protein
MKDNKELFAKIRNLNSMIEDYLDRMDMDEAEQKSRKDCKKEEK